MAVECDPSTLAFATGALRADPDLKALASSRLATGGKIPDQRTRRRSKTWSNKEALDTDDTPCTAHTFGCKNQKSAGHVGSERIVGEEGARLSEMASLGLPVAPGFCISASQKHLQNGKDAKLRVVSDELQATLRGAIADLEETTARKFGGNLNANPLLLSVRSSDNNEAGKNCMVTNVGLNDHIVGKWAQTENAHSAWDSYRRFIFSYAENVKELDMSSFQKELDEIKERLDSKCQLGRKHRDGDIPTNDLQELVAHYKDMYREQTGEEFPQDPDKQLLDVMGSALCKHDLKISALVQANVINDQSTNSGFGHLKISSTTSGLSGEWRPNVEKETTNDDFADLQEEMPGAYANILQCQDTLLHHFGDLQDVEFIVQKGQVWLLGAKTYVEPESPECESLFTESSSPDPQFPLSEGSKEEVVEPCVPLEESFEPPLTENLEGPRAQHYEAPVQEAHLCKKDEVPVPMPTYWNEETMQYFGRHVWTDNPLQREVPENQQLHALESPDATLLSLDSSFQPRSLPFWKTALAGASAGIATTGIAASFESCRNNPRGISHEFMKAFTGRIGMAGVLQNSLPMLGRGCVTGAFCCTGYFKLLCLSSRDGNPDSVTPIRRLGCAALAVAGATTLAHPVEMFRILAGRGAGPLPAKLAVAVPSMATEMASIDIVKNVGVNSGYNVTPGLLLFSGAVAGAVSTTMMNPITVAKCIAGPKNVTMLADSSGHSMKAGHQMTVQDFKQRRQMAVSYMGRMAAVSANSLLRVGMMTYFLTAGRD
eukprot:TRINITY_DN63197_c0_g1_i1.p1 TRINITY_DN63197_c0_g1~~TRINITY_DN63197_c0_g1_i1.p1  ORF type:complete len:815 (+),score=169.09 TRINITY_DN63197_c0_g1_i1:132-2447(+)